MIEQFLNFFTKEVVATIEGLTGKQAVFSNKTEDNANEQTTIKPPVVVATINVSGATTAKLLLLSTPVFMTAIGEWMMGEEEITNTSSLGADEIDAAKEVFSNILGAFSTTLGAQKDLPKLNFEVSKVVFLDENQALDLSSYEKSYIYEVKIDALDEHFGLVSDLVLNKLLNPASQKSHQEKSESSAKSSFTSDEMRNINLIMDVRLPIRVRIGSKKMLLKDVLSMDIGSVIELNQLANDPLEILIGDKPIALGEVVIIDGNFGIQITEIGTKKERLEQLR
ncbi:flagellar motor switch protein FliY [Campylobacter sputorum subsp. bubulus]|uniref:Flagellar motor switch protein FliN n=1 Tax=Campylobacter sputorum subsp. sputorum TaxID=32024 RepID=A0A381DLG1_9BACT|nr:flagellar motor switch protein FliY [Campylobacter sputorum]ASM34795.1 flagellar motor switch protein [Campylobacter sputorum aubsp. sputorum RM3237]ASM36459.1 flagellar motor switch protein [Campylobacter sputorum bv. faecalis CCUG 20703]KAB0581649.1 flagellar motor switch protein FliY [Campylobacter sputorum subsp. sputorum]QEL04988.1 flagellar motor switch C-ring protein FliY [Campylobacter sputorum subsp. sputorum]SUX10135.1 flagellar motor switch protein FliY [Campylobacter sputorum su